MSGKAHSRCEKKNRDWRVYSSPMPRSMTVMPVVLAVAVRDRSFGSFGGFDYQGGLPSLSSSVGAGKAKVAG